MDTLRPEQVMRILEVTDSFNLHRESVMIPLRLGSEGSVTILPDKRLRIVVPKARPFEDWLIELRSQLANMNLSDIRQ